ncbi:hypothetical protein HMPREF3191_01233 [Veillonellaceae bacterium DNF00626]|nr:hypothetical protein HMPREF3191_01233 [Veillonellaceae bacterium DNF00626]
MVRENISYNELIKNVDIMYMLSVFWKMNCKTLESYDKIKKMTAK